MATKVSYNQYERQTLVDLVNQHREIVDSRRVDSNTLNRKRQTWLKITTEYNRHPRVRKRLTKQLRRLWENTKARAKKQNVDTTGNSGSHQMLLNESSNEPLLDTIPSQSNHSGSDGNDFDQEYVESETRARVVSLKEEQYHERRSRDILGNCTDEGAYHHSDTAYAGGEHEVEVEGILAPSKSQQSFEKQTKLLPYYCSMLNFFVDNFSVIAARVRRNDEATSHQKEIHRLALQREHLQIRALEEQLVRQAEVHAIKMERDREVKFNDSYNF